MRLWWAVFALVGCIGDHDPPELVELIPVDGVDLRGVGDVYVRVTYRDDSHVTARMFVDAEFVGTADPRCGQSSCTADLDWATHAFAPGPHDLTMALEDDAGNVTTETRQVFLDDVLAISAMKVANITDESGTLEIEIYAFDETNTLIGCAGSRHGLATVDNAGITYSTDAGLITLDSLALATADFAGRRVRLEVWEDDDAPVCPDAPDPLGNDLVGTSPLLTADEWRAMPLLAFDDVAALGVEWTRNLAQGEDPDPPIQGDPLFGNGGGGGCQTTPSTSAGLVLVGLALMLRRRRSE